MGEVLEGVIRSFFIKYPVYIEMMTCLKFEDYRILILLFIKVLINQDFGLLWQELTGVVDFRTSSSTYKNIRI